MEKRKLKISTTSSIQSDMFRRLTLGQRKGQLTIFIILAVLVIGVVLIYFAFQTGLIQQPLNPNAEKIQVFVQNCIEQEGTETIYQIGKNGGYFFPMNLSTESGVAIYYSNNKSHMPLKEELEKEISFYLNEKLFFCTRNFVDFPDLEINQDEISTITKIEDEKVVLNVNYPITIIKDEDKTLIKDFKIEIPVRLGIVYDSVSEFMQTQTESSGICLSCLLEISERNDLFVDMSDYDEQTTLFLFRDENSKINEKNFVWVFANKYEVRNE